MSACFQESWPITARTWLSALLLERTLSLRASTPKPVGHSTGSRDGRASKMRARIGTTNSANVARRASVLDCGKTEQRIGMCACAPRPLPLHVGQSTHRIRLRVATPSSPGASNSGRGLKGFATVDARKHAPASWTARKQNNRLGCALARRVLGTSRPCPWSLLCLIARSLSKGIKYSFQPPIIT